MARLGDHRKATVCGLYRVEKDIDIWSDLVARSIRARAGGPGDIRSNVAYGYGLFTGGPLGAHSARKGLGLHRCAGVGGGMNRKGGGRQVLA